MIALTNCCKDDSKTDTGIGKPPDPPEPVEVYYRGADLSFQPEIEEYDTPYYNEDSVQIELLPYLASKGVNLVRLRLWHTPENVHSSLQEVLDYSKQVKQAGMDATHSYQKRVAGKNSS